MSNADLLAKERRPGYNCANLAAETWLHETGQDISALLGVGGLVGKCGHNMFERVSAPLSPCLVVFHRARLEAHVGVYIRGRVLHLRDKTPMRQPLSVAALGYTSVRFYAPRSTHS